MEERGMNARIKALRKVSMETQPHIDLERAKIETEVYKKYEGKVSLPVLRAMVLKEYFSKRLFTSERESLSSVRRARILSLHLRSLSSHATPLRTCIS